MTRTIDLIPNNQGGVEIVLVHREGRRWRLPSQLEGTPDVQWATRLLEAWAPAGYSDAKARAFAAFEAGAPPESLTPDGSPLAGTALRVALRQRYRTHGEDARLDLWRAHLDRVFGDDPVAGGRDPS